MLPLLISLTELASRRMHKGKAIMDATVQMALQGFCAADIERLDELMRMVGELVISRSRLQEGLQKLGAKVRHGEVRALHEINQAMERQLRDLREGLMRVRLVPIGEIFTRMQFVVRDLVREQEKQAVLELTGESTEIDKYLVERMLDPLLHLVRNSVSHGLESPAERSAAGKPATRTHQDGARMLEPISGRTPGGVAACSVFRLERRIVRMRFSFP